MTTSITTQAYTTDDALDTELAAIGYAAVRGWPDQRPITKDLVASRLTPPPGAHPTILATAHSSGGIVGWAALRPPAPGGTGRLWGPAVHPVAAHQGIGRELLDVLTTSATYQAHHHQLTTAEIPAKRRAAHAFYHQAGWQLASSATLLHLHRIPTTSPPPPPKGPLSVTSHQGGNGIADELAQLYQATNPHHGPAIAAATLTRWSSDRRFTSDNLTLARAHDGQLTAATLLYPLTHVDAGEPPEVLLADLLIHPEHHTNEALSALVDHALLAAAAWHSAATFRAVSRSPGLIHALVLRGASCTDQVLYHRPAVGRPTGETTRCRTSNNESASTG